MTNKQTLCVAFALILNVIPHLAAGQETEEEVRLSSVTVTAQRVEEDLQEVPISITTISDEKLDNLKGAGADVRFLSARIPSVIAESSFGRAFPRFYIRGFGNTDFDLNATQPISLVYDDVPYENPILKGFPVFDLESIEVLRGPQGTLFGRNTPGGIIKFDSVKPSSKTGGYSRTSYGNYGTIELEGAYGSSISEDVAYRVSGIIQHRDHYVDNAHTKQKNAYEGFDEYAFRVQLSYAASDETSMLLNIHSRDNDSTARLFRANIIDRGTNGVGKTFDRKKVYLDSAVQELKQKTTGTTLTVDHKISSTLGLTYVFGYETAEVTSRGDIDGGFGQASLGATNYGPGIIPFSSESGGNVNDLKQITHELRFEFLPNTGIKGQAGLFAFQEDIDITSLSFNSLHDGSPKNGEAIRTNETESFGAFASISYDVNESLTLSGGLRTTSDDKSFVVERTLSPVGLGTRGPIRGKKDDSQISWDISALYEVNDEVNAYFRVARGFRGPSIQGRLVFGDNVSVADSETVISWEAGVKSELFDRRLRANANLFTYTIKDQQLTVVGGQSNTVALFNADEGQGSGFEVDIEAAPANNLFITAGLSYNNTEIKDDQLLSPGCGAPVNCTILDPPVRNSNNQMIIGYNISGNPFPNAPKWIANFTARYSLQDNNGEYYGYTDWAFKGDTNFFLYESKEYSQDGYWEIGLRIGFKSKRGYDVSLFARNLADYEALTGGIDFNNLTGYVNEPRTFGITLDFEI